MKVFLGYETNVPDPIFEFREQNLSFLARGFATKLMTIILNCRSLGLPFHGENKIPSTKLVFFQPPLRVVVKYHFFHVRYTLWYLLLVFMVSFSYCISLYSFLHIMLHGVPSSHFLVFCFVVSFRTLG
jgi:hypothetical protein